MKKLNLIVIGLGLFILQPLKAQNVALNARKAVELAEFAPSTDNIAAARKAVDAARGKITSAVRNKYIQRVNDAETQLQGRRGGMIGPMPQAGMPRTPAGPMSANDFDAQLKQLESDVANLRSQWNAASGPRTVSLEEMAKYGGSTTGPQTVSVEEMAKYGQGY